MENIEVQDIFSIKKKLNENKKYDYAQISDAKCEKGCSAIYAAWLEQELIYIGRSDNIYKRLQSHYSGSRGSNQFCTYVFDYYLLKQELNEYNVINYKISKHYDEKTKEFIRENIVFSWYLIEKNNKLSKIETELRKISKPMLNPIEG
jgi:hypothetical protein